MQSGPPPELSKTKLQPWALALALRTSPLDTGSTKNATTSSSEGLLIEVK
jgi:hypothetical protein